MVWSFGAACDGDATFDPGPDRRRPVDVQADKFQHGDTWNEDKRTSVQHDTAIVGAGSEERGLH